MKISLVCRFIGYLLTEMLKRKVAIKMSYKFLYENTNVSKLLTFLLMTNS